MKKAASPVILSAAKNPQGILSSREWPRILRCAQNDTSGPDSHGLSL